MENTIEEKKVYPTTKGIDGFYFEDEIEEASDIETAKDEKGKIFKRVTLSDGRKILINRLKGKDVFKARKIVSSIDDKETTGELFQSALLELACSLDGNKVFIADTVADELDFADFTRLLKANTAVNFL